MDALSKTMGELLSMNLLSVQNISLKIQEKFILDNISFEIPKGQTTLIMGPNGAGKTLLLKCLAALLHPQKGKILNYKNQNILEFSEPELAQWRSWIPLSRDIPFNFRVRDLVVMGRYPHHKGFPDANDLKVSEQSIQRVGIRHLEDRFYNTLSRGEQTKVDIARAISHSAPLLLLDEPFANLDIEAQLQLIELLKELSDENRTIVLSHHDLYSVQDFADRLIWIKNGKIPGYGRVSEVYNSDYIKQIFAVNASFLRDNLNSKTFVRFHT